jgi:hypothetical protein
MLVGIEVGQAFLPVLSYLQQGPCKLKEKEDFPFIIYHFPFVIGRYRRVRALAGCSPWIPFVRASCDQG